MDKYLNINKNGTLNIKQLSMNGKIGKQVLSLSQNNIYIETASYVNIIFGQRKYIEAKYAVATELDSKNVCKERGFLATRSVLLLAAIGISIDTLFLVQTCIMTPPRGKLARPSLQSLRDLLVCYRKCVSMEIPIAPKSNTLRVAKKPLSLHTYLESSSVAVAS